jgi:hypothetical protein
MAMRRPQWGWYAVALAILVVGLVWVGVPANTLLLGAVLLACPLMMVFMMRGMHGEGQANHRHDSPPSDERPDDFHDMRNR